MIPIRGATEASLVTRLLRSYRFFCSLQDNRPLSKAFFTAMIQVEKQQVCIQLYSVMQRTIFSFLTCDNGCLSPRFLFQDSPKMNNLRGYYERALQEFGTYDDGKV